MMHVCTDRPTPVLLQMVALCMELEQPIPVDLIVTLNSRGIIIDTDHDFGDD